MNNSEIIQIIAIVIPVAGLIVIIIYNIIQVKSLKKQLKINSFSDYTKRYQEILLNLPLNINSENFDIEKLDPKIKEKTLLYIKAYADLCSEEYYLWQEGYLDDKVWEEWESGIKFTFSKPAFKQAWKIIDPDSKFYTDFYKWINENIDLNN